MNNEKTARVAEEEFHRSRWWAYKWVKRFAENLAGWKAKEIMNISYERTGVRYHEVHIHRLLPKWKQRDS